MFEINQSRRTIIILIGIPASGKTTFYRRFFKGSFEHINLDTLHTRNNEQQIIESCIADGKSFVVDNTNPAKDDRCRYIPLAKASGYHVVAVYFESKVSDCIARNANRTGKARIPDTAVASISNKLELPEASEGFDEMYFVRIENGEFIIMPWRED